ncbi:hypothetical protein BAY61_02020 [Prauserella marina]|uniref:Uncharacterized protein n=1 Tax=Prauserella marina TaxID=530584 RepID=A0A222VJ61_9PSEU|nr:DUF3093 family protein [Prauserella marina]ASR33969.1 hypothetical protein BAY61_02020 [Prauserella marina]PWV82580.1 hypothetical protein DES30_102823 [Prauserella marina]SDC72441.1 Protein of unknown function [Prauserella marina]
MTDHYRERGASGWPLLWGPLFALLGYLAERFTGGDRPHTVMWLAVGIGLLWLTSIWVYARRRFLVVRVTDTELVQGREQLPVERIAKLTGVGAPAGTRVLGGGWSVPRKYEELPLKLDDGTVVLAWAWDAEELRDALESVMRKSAP